MSIATTAVTTGRRADFFYTGAALAALAISGVAFGPSLLNQTARRGSLTPAVAWHVGFAMFLLLVLIGALYGVIR